MTVLRLYLFHRRSGMTRRRALSRAWESFLRDLNFRSVKL